jgi:hypothetical protein
MLAVNEKTPFITDEPFQVAEASPQQIQRYKTFFEENKHSFDDGISRSIDRSSGFDLARYNRNQRIFKIVVAGVIIIVIVVVVVCIL